MMADALQLAPRLYHFSRDAIHSLFGAFNYPIQTPVWMPSYHCGMEVRAAADAGFSPRFYKVNKDLSADVDDLAKGLRDELGPVLLIHYFGFPQHSTSSVVSLCRQRGVPLVEDCSHAFLSWLGERELGTFGQAATFSLYKTLGTSDGGALRVEQTELSRLTGHQFSLPPTKTRPTIAWQDHRRIWRASASFDQNGRRRQEELAGRFEDRVVTAKRRIFEGEWLYGRGISRLSLALIQRLDTRMVVERRRRNYLQLDSMLCDVRNYRPVFSVLPAETCPLYLPIFVRDRTKVLVGLQAVLVETFIFGMFNHPAMDTERFSDSRVLREEILCLPVHQDLEESDLTRMAAALRPLLEADA
jgi:dTDP-4-amino-4,6-dideoxygalactose transaminase